jgi:hypothetical protein
MISFVDIRKSGYKAVKEEMEKDNKAVVTYKGKAKFVILPIEEYNNLELDAIYNKVMDDYRKGNYTVLSSDEDIDKHIESL